MRNHETSLRRCHIYVSELTHGINKAIPRHVKFSVTQTSSPCMGRVKRVIQQASEQLDADLGRGQDTPRIRNELSSAKSR